MLEHEAYRAFREAIHGGNVPEEDFDRMLGAEATFEQSRVKRLRRGDANKIAVDRMVRWFQDGYEGQVRINQDNLAKWIATYRRTALWCMALGAEHRMED